VIRKVLLAAALLAAGGVSHATIILSEGFDDVSTLAGSGWTQTNSSAPAGTTGWFQGNDGVFGSHSGAANSYIAANFENAGFGGNISNWLITPTLTFTSRLFLTFSTRGNGFLPDRLEVRLSTNGGSGDVGSSDTSVGDFTTLLATINPLLGGDYPTDWTTYTLYLGEYAGPTLGRLAFRYFVPDTSLNADYIGIDSVSVRVPEPATLGLFAMSLIAMAFVMLGPRRRRIAALRR